MSRDMGGVGVTTDVRVMSGHRSPVAVGRARGTAHEEEEPKPWVM